MSRSPQTGNPNGIKRTYLGYLNFLALFRITCSEGLWYLLDFNKYIFSISYKQILCYENCPGIKATHFVLQVSQILWATSSVLGHQGSW